MWIYFNDEEKVVTSIPHGESIKQGGSFNVYVAFNKSYFQKIIGKESLVYTSEELINWINDNYAATFTFEENPSKYPLAKLMRFEKIKDNESICLLKDKETYVVFQYIGLPSETEIFGDHELIFRLSRYIKNNAGNNIEHEVKIAGPINVYVEATYGYKPLSSNVSMEQIDLLLEHVKEYQKESYERIKELITQSNGVWLGTEDEYVHDYGNGKILEDTICFVVDDETQGFNIIQEKNILYIYEVENVVRVNDNELIIGG